MKISLFPGPPSSFLSLAIRKLHGCMIQETLKRAHKMNESYKMNEHTSFHQLLSVFYWESCRMYEQGEWNWKVLQRRRNEARPALCGRLTQHWRGSSHMLQLLGAASPIKEWNGKSTLYVHTPSKSAAQLLDNLLHYSPLHTFIRGLTLLFGISEWECSSFTATPYSALAGHSSHTFTVAWVTSPGYLLHSCTSSGLVGLKHSTMCRLCLTPCGSEQDIICC